MLHERAVILDEAVAQLPFHNGSQLLEEVFVDVTRGWTDANNVDDHAGGFEFLARS